MYRKTQLGGKDVDKMEILQKGTYLSMIRNAAGTKMFRSLWGFNPRLGMKDLLDSGKKSCAVFVSSVLFLFGLVSSKRATVVSLEQDLIASGWRKILFPGPGDIIIWEPRMQGGHRNIHIGFFLGGNRAMSNDWKSCAVREHHWTYGTKKNGQPVRRITAVYTHDFLK